MKKSVLIFILSILVFSINSKAQILEVNEKFHKNLGVKLGVNMQMLDGVEWRPAYNTSIAGGVYYELRRYQFGFRCEALFSQANYTTAHTAGYFDGHKYYLPGYDTTNHGDFNASFFSIPVLFEYKIYKKIFLVTGLQYSYMLSFKDNNGGYSTDFPKNGKNVMGGTGINVDNIMKKGGFSMVLGAEVQLQNKLSLGIRILRGLTDENAGIFYRAHDVWKINSGQITLGFKIK